jgi:hypothetical protein
MEIDKYNKQAKVINNSISIGGNICRVQIQQNTENSKQTMNIVEEFDYEKIFKVLNEIKEYFEFPKFNNDFGEKSDEIKNCVNKTLELVEKREKPEIIKKSLLLLKELAIGVTGSLIATGIVNLVSPII